MKRINYTLLAILTIIVFVSSCTSDAPKVTKVNGHTMVQTNRRFIGIPVWTSEDEVLTEEQRRERAEFESDMKIEERQKAVVFWFGALCLVSAVGCVVAGYFFHGWKFWGGLAMLSAGIGALSWGFESFIPYLKWVFGAGLASVVLWSMWRFKEFSAVKWIESRKEKKEEADVG